MRLKFTDFKLLHDVIDNLCKKITIKIPIGEINNKSIENVARLCKQNKGKQSLRFAIYDLDDKIELNVPSRNTKIKITSDLLKTLEKEQINFKLN
ncbi:MAG: Uncharacterised protein [Flavobacterium sp. SCGC AAA160-P02]|nr:MAG: Uncharacterised protein [Flavobacterium sp. SCGC AAA160-P02]